MRRPLLLPLVPLYAAGLWVARRLAVQPKRLGWPVVSVGSLSAGGAGKTPVVSALAELLGRHGYSVDVLSRGYGRRSDVVEWVDPAGDAGRYGDEPMVLARAGLRVYVGADRYRVGVLAEASDSLEIGGLEEPMSQGRDLGHPDPHPVLGPVRRVHLLDDGLQHRRLARALDVALLTVEDVEDWLLPAGNLREPLGRLAAAGAVVLREDEAEALREVVARLAPGVPVWVVRRRLVVDGVSAHPFAFCGIARPMGFLSMLAALGVEVEGNVSFGDHYRYTEADPYRLVDEARRLGADGFVTTEKDAVKLSAPMLKRLKEVGPVGIARLRVEFLDEDAVIAEIREKDVG